MPLTSIFFSSNQRLQDCLVRDSAHVLEGDRGEHVSLIQAAIMMLDGADIDLQETRLSSYGRSTSAAVLAYKQSRGIINPAYQTTADPIVGKMTIADLDQEMRVLEAPFTILPGLTAVFRGLLFAPVVKVKPPKLVIVTEMNPPWLNWALQTKKHFDALPDTKGVVLVHQVPGGLSVQAVAHRLAAAAAEAGPLGVIVLSVGHGAVGDEIDGGTIDLGPSHSFRLGGRDEWLVGQPEPPKIRELRKQKKPIPKPSEASAFYADRPASSGGITAFSELENDQNSGSAAAKTRVSNFRNYELVCSAFKPLLLIVALTCKVGGSIGFLRKVRQQTATPILAYKRRVSGQQQANGRTRLFLEGDAPGTGTNVASGEFTIPLSPDSVLVL